jgi:small subunit ribosomal protein S6
LRRYETILIAHADLSEDDLAGLITRYGSIVTAQKGILIKVERWGKRKLAYLIRKQARGFYILVDFAGESAVVNELERNLKIDDKILKFMTIQKAEKVDPAALEKELAAAAKPEEPPSPSPQTIVESAAAAEPAAPMAAEDQPSIPEESHSEAKGEKES